MSNYNKKYKFLRPIIIYLYNFRCYLCDIIPDNYEVHHVDKKVKNNSPFNLFPLCPLCHSKVHSGVYRFVFKVPRSLINSLQSLESFLNSSNL